jgi:hypothetical protein
VDANGQAITAIEPTETGNPPSRQGTAPVSHD